jgi:hypothetical protein
VPALAATCPTRWRYALALPALNYPPCKNRTASSDRLEAGRTQRPGILPTVPASNVTSARGDTPSINASNCARASTLQLTPFVLRAAALIAVTADASSGSSGCVVTNALVLSLVERCMVAERQFPVRLQHAESTGSRVGRLATKSRHWRNVGHKLCVTRRCVVARESPWRGASARTGFVRGHGP